MNAMGPTRWGVASIVLLLIAPLPAGAEHGGDFDVTAVSTDTIRRDVAQQQLLTFTLQNNKAGVEVDTIEISIPTASEPLSIVDATATGFTAATADNDDGGSGPKEVVTLTADGGDGIDAGATLQVTLDILVTNDASDGEVVTFTLKGTDDAGSPDTAQDTYAITIEDPDIIPSETSISVLETGDSETFDVVLAAPPSGDVVVDASFPSADTSFLSFSDSSDVNALELTFTAGNWDTAQTITVYPKDDGIGQPGGRTTTVTLAIDDAQSANDYDGAVDQEVEVIVADDENVGVTLSQSSVATSETGDPATFTVVLDTEPSQDVQLAISSANTALATVSPATLDFDDTDWNVPQTVSVIPKDDGEVNTAPRATTVTVETSANNDALEYEDIQETVAVSITDDPHGITMSHTAGVTQAIEGGATDTFTVVLDSKPMTDVVLDLSVSIPSEATVSPTSLTFTNSNWNTAQTVTLTAIDDTVQDGALSTTISIKAAVRDSASDAEYDGVPDGSLTASIIDNDRAGILVTESGGSTVVGEAAGDRTDTIDIQLTGQPADSVQLTLSALVADTTTASTDVSVLPDVLLFTTQNWNVPQTVSITALDDSVAEGQELVDLIVSVAAGSSGEYAALDDVKVIVTVNDDDEAGLTLADTTGLSTTESGGTDTFTVKLAKQPTSNVVVQLSSSATDEATVSPSSLTFTSSNWNTARSVTLTGKDDTLNDGHQDVTITLSIDAARSDDRFAGVADRTVTVTNKDNEHTVMARPGTLQIEEGATGGYNVSLTVQPAGDVQVTVVTPSGLSASPQRVTFTAADWDDIKSVTLTSADNRIKQADRKVTVSHNIASVDTSYDVSESVEVTILDDDTFDLEKANEDLQESVKVERDGDENVITWDISDVDGDPMGVQIWRATSPYEMIETLDNETDEYDDEEFRDEEDRDARYIVTVYFDETEEGGFFTSSDDITDVPGYMDLDDDELDDLAVSSGDEGLSDAAIIGGTIVGLLILVAIIVLIVVLVRRRKKDDWDDLQEDDWDKGDGSDEAWDEPVDERTRPWTDAGWQVEPEPRPVKEEGWDGWDDWSDEAPDEERLASDEGTHEWDRPGDEAPEGEWDDAGGDEPDAAPWEDEPHEPTGPGGDTFHLTCPACRHDFTAVGQKPLTTHCPNCGVEGTLR